MGGSNKERKSRGGHGLFDWDKIRDDRWKGVYLGSSVHGISSRYAKVKDLEWYKKVDGKDLALDAQNEMDEIKRKEEEAFAQALGYSMPSVTTKSVPKISKEELKQVITETSTNYNEEQGGIGYSATSLRDFKDSIKDHLDDPIGRSKSDKVGQSALSEAYNGSRRSYQKSSDRSADISTEKYSREKYNKSPERERHRERRRSKSPYSSRRHDRKPYSKNYDKYASSNYSRNEKKDSKRSP